MTANYLLDMSTNAVSLQMCFRDCNRERNRIKILGLQSSTYKHTQGEKEGEGKREKDFLLGSFKY